MPSDCEAILCCPIECVNILVNGTWVFIIRTIRSRAGEKECGGNMERVNVIKYMVIEGD